MDDPTLAAALALDLDGTFEVLVLNHQDRLYSIALRILADRADADDATQDTFVRAYRALSDYPVERIRALALRPWLAAIVVNVCRNRRRRASDRRPPLSLAPLVAAGFDREDDDPPPEAVGERRDEAGRWAARLSALPLPTRTAVVLRHVDGLSYAEIAEAVERPEGTVKAQVHRGLRQLRTILEQEHATERQEMTA